ncbi:MAG: tetratricopeptide repeat protein [Planctomycetota bacterium]
MPAELDNSIPELDEPESGEPVPIKTGRKASGPKAEEEEEDPLVPLVRGQFMRIARGFEEHGDIHQAIGIYTKIINEYPDAKEAGESRMALYNLAEKYLHSGDTYSAMALFEEVM